MLNLLRKTPMKDSFVTLTKTYRKHIDTCSVLLISDVSSIMNSIYWPNLTSFKIRHYFQHFILYIMWCPLFVYFQYPMHFEF